MNHKASVVSSLALAISLGLAGSANGAIITFTGADTGVGPPGPFPLSAAAAAAFDAAIGPHPLITFEGLPLGTFVNLNVGSGVNANLANLDPAFSRITNIDQHAAPSPLGFNITPGGVEWLQVAPFAPDPAGGAVTFSFPTPVQAFGAYLTDTQSTFPGPITLTFNDGIAETLSITKNGDAGGALFLGFTDFGTSFSSVTFHTGAIPDGTRDIWGIDDIRFASAAVPEPASLLLLGTALLGLSAIRRRKRT